MKLTCVILACLVSGALLMGCSGGEGSDGLTKEQKAHGDRFADIMTKSGGSWDKLSADDKNFVIGMTNGNEQAARRMFEMRAARSAAPVKGASQPPGG